MIKKNNNGKTLFFLQAKLTIQIRLWTPSRKASRRAHRQVRWGWKTPLLGWGTRDGRPTDTRTAYRYPTTRRPCWGTVCGSCTLLGKAPGHRVPMCSRTGGHKSLICWDEMKWEHVNIFKFYTFIRVFYYFSFEFSFHLLTSFPFFLMARFRITFLGFTSYTLRLEHMADSFHL